MVDELDAAGNTYPLTDNGSVGGAGSLYAVPAGAAGARTFDGSTQYFSGATDAAFRTAIKGEWTITAVVKADVVTGAGFVAPVLHVGGANNDAGVAENVLVSFRIKEGGVLSILWEDGTQTDISRDTTDVISAGTVYMIFARKKTTVSGSSGNYDVTLGFWNLETGTGSTETFANVSNATDGDNAAIYLGHDLTDYFDGTLDEVRIESYAMSDEGIRRLALDYAADYDEQTLYNTGVYKSSLRVKIEDGDGVLRDLTDQAHGQDFVVSAEWNEDIDQPTADASVGIAREFYDWSLARDMEASALNLRASDSLFDPLIDIRRRLLIETAVVPTDHTPRDIDYCVAFDGFVDEVDWANDVITVKARDRIAELQDTFIEDTGLTIDSVDDSGSGGTLEITTAEEHGLVAGDVARVYGTTNFNGEYTVKSVASAYTFTTVESVSGSPAAETAGTLFGPDMTTYGSEAGVAAETVLQSIVDDNAPSAGWAFGPHSVYTPTSPAWQITTYNQQLEPVFTALDAIASMIGWQVRYVWDDDVYDFRLTYSEPDRSKTTPDFTFGAFDCLDVNRVAVSLADVRNSVVVRYRDSATGQRRQVSASDGSSLTKYGRRWALISEADTSLIDSATEAQALADAFIADLKEPKAFLETQHTFRRFVSLGDLYRFSANGRLWSENKDLAVTGYQHRFSDGGSTTSLRLRGQPAAARNKWLARIVHPSLNINTPTRVGVGTPTGVAITGALSRSLTLSWDDTTVVRRRGEFFGAQQANKLTEVHISTSSGFFPSDDTLRGITNGTSFTVTGLEPSRLYYYRLRHNDLQGNKGTPTAAVDFSLRDDLVLATFLETPPTLTATGNVEFSDLVSEDSGNQWASFEFTADGPTVNIGATVVVVYNSGTSVTAQLELQEDTGGGFATYRSTTVTNITGEHTLALTQANRVSAVGYKYRARLVLGGTSPSVTFKRRVTFLKARNV